MSRSSRGRHSEPPENTYTDRDIFNVWSRLLKKMSGNASVSSDSGLIFTEAVPLRRLRFMSSKSGLAKDLNPLLWDRPDDELYHLVAFPTPHAEDSNEGSVEAIMPDSLPHVCEQWERVVKLAIGLGWVAAIHAVNPIVPQPGYSWEEALAVVEEEQNGEGDEHEFLEPPGYALDGRLSIESMDAAVDEKLATTLRFREESPEAADELWATSLMWVSDELAQLTVAMARTLPDDFVPQRHDLGLFPRSAYVVFAGHHITANVWHCWVKESEILFLPTTAGNTSFFAAPQEHWQFGQAMREASEYYRVFWSFVLLINEPLTWSHPERLGRPQVRRILRAGREPSDVLIVTLRRRREEPTGEHRLVNWSHSWIVNPHWRNQWYQSEGRHKPKFIHAYVKGDGPLIVKNRVFRVSR